LFALFGAPNQALFDSAFFPDNGSDPGTGYYALKYAIAAMIGMIGGMSVPLFGLGGGVVYVPSLALLFTDFSVAQVARGTSMASVFLNSAFATWLIWKRGALPLDVLRRVVPGSVAGAILGVAFANTVDSDFLKVIISVVIAYAAFQMIFNAERRQKATQAQSP
jgi:uncharacterized membrane protein YfcA